MLNVTICVGSSCHLRGSGDIIKTFQREIQQQGLGEKIVLKGSFCMGECIDGVCITLEEEGGAPQQVRHVDRSNAKAVFDQKIAPLVQ